MFRRERYSDPLLVLMTSSDRKDESLNEASEIAGLTVGAGWGPVGMCAFGTGLLATTRWNSEDVTKMSYLT